MKKLFLGVILVIFSVCLSLATEKIPGPVLVMTGPEGKQFGVSSMAVSLSADRYTVVGCSKYDPWWLLYVYDRIDNKLYFFTVDTEGATPEKRADIIKALNIRLEGL